MWLKTVTVSRVGAPNRSTTNGLSFQVKNSSFGILVMVIWWVICMQHFIIINHIINSFTLKNICSNEIKGKLGF